jgi:hypothetical protein
VVSTGNRAPIIGCFKTMCGNTKCLACCLAAWRGGTQSSILRALMLISSSDEDGGEEGGRDVNKAACASSITVRPVLDIVLSEMHAHEWPIQYSGKYIIPFMVERTL